MVRLVSPTKPMVQWDMAKAIPHHDWLAAVGRPECMYRGIGTLGVWRSPIRPQGLLGVCSTTPAFTQMPCNSLALANALRPLTSSLWPKLRHSIDMPWLAAPCNSCDGCQSLACTCTSFDMGGYASRSSDLTIMRCNSRMCRRE